MICMIYLFISFFSFSAGLRTSFFPWCFFFLSTCLLARCVSVPPPSHIWWWWWVMHEEWKKEIYTNGYLRDGSPERIRVMWDALIEWVETPPPPCNKQQASQWLQTVQLCTACPPPPGYLPHSSSSSWLTSPSWTALRSLSAIHTSLKCPVLVGGAVCPNVISLFIPSKGKQPSHMSPCSCGDGTTDNSLLSTVPHDIDISRWAVSFCLSAFFLLWNITLQHFLIAVLAVLCSTTGCFFFFFSQKQRGFKNRDWHITRGLNLVLL